MTQYETWLADPGELQISDELFDPVNETWISVESLVYETGTFVVYDIQTKGTNTFIANGLLLDHKFP